MTTSILFSLFLPLAISLPSDWKSNCGDAEHQSLLKLISTDIFARHFNAGVLNESLTECSNFHRRLCPKGGLPRSTSTQGLFNQIAAIERGCTKYDVFTKIENNFETADQFDYTNETALSALLFPMPKSTLIAIYEYITLHIQAPADFFSNVWDVRHWNSTLDQEKFPAKYDPSIFTDDVKRKNFTDELASDLKTIIEKTGGIQKMKNAYLPFLKDVTDYNHIVNVMFREGLDSGKSRDRHDDSMVKVSEEYGRVLKTAAWSSQISNGKTVYDRFYDRLVDIYRNTLHSNLNNIGVQNASATFSRDFYNFYLDEHSELSSLKVLPFFRNFIAINRAHARTIATVDLDMPNRWKITSSTVPNAIQGFFVWIIVRNTAIFNLVCHNSPDGAVFGVMGYLYGHELYHGVERELYPELMKNSPVVADSKSCVKSYFDIVADRFRGDARFDHWPFEEEADVYGTQIAFGAFKTALGSRIDEVVYPNISQRQLFFYANSIFGCNVHSALTINGNTLLYDAHYEVNGRLAQVSEFQSTFKCSDSDSMVFLKASNLHCPIFRPSYTA